MQAYCCNQTYLIKFTSKYNLSLLMLRQLWWYTTWGGHSGLFKGVSHWGVIPFPAEGDSPGFLSVWANMCERSGDSFPISWRVSCYSGRRSLPEIFFSSLKRVSLARTGGKCAVKTLEYSWCSG